MRHFVYNVRKAFALSEANVRGNGCKVYWWNGRVNFGDLLTPELMRHFGRTPIHTFPGQHGEQDWVMVGSLLEMLSPEYEGNILGTGLIAESTCRFLRARIWSVRGPHTRRRLGLAPSTSVGDPGLLSDRLIRSRPESTHLVGLVPHYADKRHDWISTFSRNHPRQVLVIDVEREPRKVIADIARCRMIASSSLHGLIVADALHIPNTWLGLSDEVVGKGFKFSDYNAAIGTSQRPIDCGELRTLVELERAMSRKDVDAIEQVKAQIETTILEALTQTR